MFFIFMILFILLITRPSFTWFGIKRELYQKLRQKTWQRISSYEIQSSDKTLLIRRYTSTGIAGSVFATYVLTDATKDEFICSYKSSTNFVATLEHGISNPLGKIINPILDDYEAEVAKAERDLLKAKVKSI